MSACFPPFPVILLVDRNREARAQARGLIRERLPACEVLEACDGPQALEAVRRVRPAMVVLDGQMTGPSALEAAAHIRDEAPDTRMVLLTAGEPAAAHAQGLTTLHKPVRDETVEQMLQIGGWLQ
jgi:CheY-like chemotaxis protein